MISVGVFTVTASGALISGMCTRLRDVQGLRRGSPRAEKHLDIQRAGDIFGMPGLMVGDLGRIARIVRCVGSLKPSSVGQGYL